MQCPFLRETQVESCRHSLVHEMIVRNPENLSLERCSSPAYIGCPVYATAPESAIRSASRCPYLEESLVQYCAAAPVPKFIPLSVAPLSRCGSAAFHYCDLYITMAHPEEADVPHVDGIPAPSWLKYAGNHMWLDAADDGVMHIGIDALLARTLGRLDRITYLTERCFPSGRCPQQWSYRFSHGLPEPNARQRSERLFASEPVEANDRSIPFRMAVRMPARAGRFRCEKRTIRRRRASDALDAIGVRSHERFCSHAGRNE